MAGASPVNREEVAGVLQEGYLHLCAADPCELKMVCDKDGCERWCVKDGVTKMVCDKVVCERWYVTKMVCDKVVCERCYVNGM